eukprot:scaffold52728_cov69-Phaeocystis_antarctica.AAC.2
MDRSPKDAKRPDGGFGVDGGPRSGRWGRPPALGGLPLTVGSELGLADGPGPNTIVRNRGVRFGGVCAKPLAFKLATPSISCTLVAWAALIMPTWCSSVAAGAAAWAATGLRGATRASAERQRRRSSASCRCTSSRSSRASTQYTAPVWVHAAITLVAVTNSIPRGACMGTAYRSGASRPETRSSKDARTEGPSGCDSGLRSWCGASSRGARALPGRCATSPWPRSKLRDASTVERVKLSDPTASSSSSRWTPRVSPTGTKSISAGPSRTKGKRWSFPPLASHSTPRAVSRARPPSPQRRPSTKETSAVKRPSWTSRAVRLLYRASVLVPVACSTFERARLKRCTPPRTLTTGSSRQEARLNSCQYCSQPLRSRRSVPYGSPKGAAVALLQLLHQAAARQQDLLQRDLGQSHGHLVKAHQRHAKPAQPAEDEGVVMHVATVIGSVDRRACRSWQAIRVGCGGPLEAQLEVHSVQLEMPHKQTRRGRFRVLQHVALLQLLEHSEAPCLSRLRRRRVRKCRLNRRDRRMERFFVDAQGDLLQRGVSMVQQREGVTLRQCHFH